MNYFRALTIAGSDSGGGAGIQADLKTFSALGCYGMSVITALTAQNTKTVRSIYPVSPDFVCDQIDAVIEDMGVDSVKIGMLHSSKMIKAVAGRLEKWKVKNIVVDPVMVSKSGHSLLERDGFGALKSILLPIATVLTPNLPEASLLLGREIVNRSQMQDAAEELLGFGSQSVFLKGGHLNGNSIADCFVDENRTEWFESVRVDTKNTHGTGCTLSAAIAAELARGTSLFDAVTSAKSYLLQAIEVGARYSIGHGHGPVHHFHKKW